MGCGCRNAQSLEVPEARWSPRFILVPERPVVLFVASLDEATDLQSPRLHRIAREAQLAVGNANLRCPPVTVDVCRRLPDRIPRRVAAGVADPDVIRLLASWVYLEEGATQVIVVRVDDELEVIGGEVRVAPHEPRRDTARAERIVELRADVQRVGVEEEAYFAPLGRGLPLVWIELREFGDRPCRGPRRFVEPAIEHDASTERCRDRARHGNRVPVAVSLSRGHCIVGKPLCARGADRRQHEDKEQAPGESRTRLATGHHGTPSDSLPSTNALRTIGRERGTLISDATLTPAVLFLSAPDVLTPSTRGS